MIKTRHIQPGDAVGIVAPSSPVTESQIEPGLRLLEERGYEVVLGNHVWERDGFLAGPDDHRVADIERMFADPKIKAVICARGGYGVSRVMDRLDLRVVAENPKLLVGFSDITFLQMALLNELGLVTLYGPMLISWVMPHPPSVADLWFRAMEVPEPLPPLPLGGGAETLTPGSAEGAVVGGCLCLLAAAIGTPYEIPTDETLLLLEDINEPPHKVDSMLQQLRQSGFLSGVEGLVIGEMTWTDDRADPKIGSRPAREILVEHLGKRGVPAVIGFPFGHVVGALTLPLGIRASLDADAGTLTYLESATT
jgi:muramoyltetrapeptide carboxypeptidase